ncbi:MAG: hypothetical protein ABI680_06755 [Chthoniobacteraceae bacterium]
MPFTDARRVKNAKAATTVNTTGPALEPRLTNAWLATATRIKTPDFVIYYKGHANRHSPPDQVWTGDIQGDVLRLTARSATVVSDGDVSVRVGGSITATGSTRTVLAEPGTTPPWQHLLEIP